MKIVATSDTHFPIPKEKIPDGDVLIVAGDLMYSGYPDEWYPRLDALATLPHKTKLFVAGNHDIHLDVYKGPACAEMRERGIVVVGEPVREPFYTLDNGLRILGLPFVTNLPRWAFNRGEEWLDDYLQSVGRADIIVSHSPPSGILDSDGKSHYGIKAYRRYLKMYQPDYWIVGHVHESYGEDAKEGCHFFNVSMCNGDYKQVNKPLELTI